MIVKLFLTQQCLLLLMNYTFCYRTSGNEKKRKGLFDEKMPKL